MKTQDITTLDNRITDLEQQSLGPNPAIYPLTYQNLKTQVQNIAAGGGSVTSVTASGSGITASPTTGNVVLQNTGVISLSGGTGLGVSASTGSISLSNTGVTSLSAGTNIMLSGTTGAISISASGSGGGTAGSWNSTVNNSWFMNSSNGVITLAHTLGKQPSFGRVTAYSSANTTLPVRFESVGSSWLFNPTTYLTSVIWWGTDSGGNLTYGSDSSGVVSLNTQGGSQVAQFTADSGNVYLTFTKTGTPTGSATISLMVEIYG